MPWLLLVLSLSSAAFVANALWPLPRNLPMPLTFASFFAGWLLSELPLHSLVGQALLTGWLCATGALSRWPGVVGLGLTALSFAGIFLLVARSREAEAVLENALKDSLGGEYRAKSAPQAAGDLALPAQHLPWRSLVFPFPMRHSGVEKLRGLQYARVEGLDLKLDIYRSRAKPASEARGCPVLLEIHGGAWVIGSKDEQGIPLMLHLASQGFVCVTANYRLSPRATFPDPLVDLKRAIAWIRQNIQQYGGDPSFLVVTGGSAGGHLASLVALTQNNPEYQPGFEEADTSIQACVPFYGVYDFTNRQGLYTKRRAEFLEEYVMKASLEEARERYKKASPTSRVSREAPPFFVIHGALDSLVAVEEARHFVERLRGVSLAPVAYAELPGAQHAFDIFPSLRTARSTHAVERFLTFVRSQYAASAPPIAAVR